MNMFSPIWKVSIYWLGLCAFSSIQAVAADEDVVANLILYPAVDMIDASWILLNPSGDVTRYHVFWTGTNAPHCYSPFTATNSSDCSSAVTLESCSFYVVTVQPQKPGTPMLVDTGTPESASSYTLPAGDIAISDVACSAGDDLSATVEWSGPGGCVEYTVSYTATVLWGDQDSLHDSLTTRELSASFTDLVPYTRYSFTVQADGAPAVDACNTTTPEKEPSAPTDVTVSNTTATSALASWLEPDLANGMLLQYRVQWQSSEGDSGQKDTTQTSLVLDNLRACSNYSVTVAASTSEGFGDDSSPANFYTDAADVFIGNVACSAGDDLSATVEWSGPGGCVEYTVSYTATVLWGDQDSLHDSLTTRELSASFTDLVPYTRYSFTVQADGAPAVDACNTTTPEKAPSAPPSLHTSSISSSIERVSWGRPEEENGIIISYTVRWTISNDTEAETTATVPSDEFSYDVPDLQQCVPYVFSVSASTSAGEGKAASTVDTPLSEETEAPVVICEDDDWTTVVVWSEAISMCPIKEYAIRYTVDVIWSDDESSVNETVDGSVTNFQVQDTIPYSWYSYEVSAVIAGGVPGPAGTCSLETAEAAPSAPRNLKEVDATTNSITISFEEPEELNGVLYYYEISWQSESESWSYSHHLSSSNGQSLYMYKINNLVPSKGYNVRVWGVTVADGPAAEGKFYTEEGPPGATTYHPATSRPYEVAESSTRMAIIIGCLVILIALAALVGVVINSKKFSSPRRPTQPRPSREGLDNNAYQGQVLHTMQPEPENPAEAFERLNELSRRGPTLAGLSPQNVIKNRNMNILPFDDTRVQLGGEEKASCDYINASFIKDPAGGQRLIVSQGPTDGTLGDFWHMVWQEKVDLIVMLTNCEEYGQSQCHQYWPESIDSPVFVGSFSVYLRHLAVDFGLNRRRLLLQKNRELPRDVIQIHMEDWPEHGLPTNQQTLLRLLDCVRADTSPCSTILVHCSAGDGRSGTFVALWKLQQKAERREPIDIDETILQIREDRMGLVQTEGQYLLIYKCMAEYLQTAHARIPAAGGYSAGPMHTHQPQLQPPPFPHKPSNYMEDPPAYENISSSFSFELSNTTSVAPSAPHLSPESHVRN